MDVNKNCSYPVLDLSSVIQTSQLMLYREIIAVCSQIHTKHTNSEFLTSNLAVPELTTVSACNGR
jgi:hypothetical protein